MGVRRGVMMTLCLQSKGGGEGGDYCECAGGPLVDVDGVSGIVLLVLLCELFRSISQPHCKLNARCSCQRLEFPVRRRVC